MKKIISVLLTVLLIAIPFFAMNVSAAEITKTDALFDAIEENKEITVTFRTGKSEEFGDSWSTINTIYLKGEKVAYDFNNGMVTVRTLVDENALVSYFPSFPLVYMRTAELPFGNFDIWEIIKGSSDFTMEFLVFVNSYETEIDGVKYYVEEFSDRGSVINSFFYVNDELKILKAQDFAKETIQYTYFDKVSLTVDDSIFKLPAISFDFTTVLKFFMTLLTAA